MLKTVPNPIQSNAPMTRGQRRALLALEEQKRRRKRLGNLGSPAGPPPAILLASDGHGRLTWSLNFTSPNANINIYKSADGVTWPADPFDGCPLVPANRDCSGMAAYFRIIASDSEGNDVPPYSNVVHSDGL